MADESLSEISTMDISKLKVPDLKKELKLRGLSTSGNKNDLIERLQTFLKGTTVESVDDLDEDLLNDDDDEHLDGNESVINELDNDLDDSPQSKARKRKLSENQGQKNVNQTKKVILNRNNSNSESSKVTVDAKVAIENEDVGNDEKKVIKLSELSAKERLEMRAKKFGVTLSTDAKKVVRAERFGNGNSAKSASSIISTNVNTSLDVLKQRAQRFGCSVSTVMSNIENKEKLEKRKARFGGATTTNGAVSQADKAKQRLERFKQPVK